MSTLKSIDEHNKAKRKDWERRFEPIPTGFACPKCGKEAVKPQSANIQWQQVTYNPMEPPSDEVQCSDLMCGWRGRLYR